jgi:hypothetical protein
MNRKDSTNYHGHYEASQVEAVIACVNSYSFGGNCGHGSFSYISCVVLLYDLGAHDGAHPFFAAVLSVGTIAVMRATIMDDSLRWDVDGDQTCLVLPRYSLFLYHSLPENDTPVTVNLAPVEKQASTQYLLGFHAGSILVEGITSSRDNEPPVLV